MYPLAIFTAIANVLVLEYTDTDAHLARSFYIAGAVFNALHFAFGTRDLAILKRIHEKEKDNGAAMADWVRMNLLRGVIAEFPSWLCFLVEFVAGTTDW